MISLYNYNNAALCQRNPRIQWQVFLQMFVCRCLKSVTILELKMTSNRHNVCVNLMFMALSRSHGHDF